MDLSIIIPAYNEAERLPQSLGLIQTYLQQHTELTAEVLVVDDGSTDQTAVRAKQAMPAARIIRHPHNLGKGAAVRTGMLAATGEWRYLCDADLSTPITELDRLFTYRDQADIILGSRRVAGAKIGRNQSPLKVWLGQAGNVFIQMLVAPGIHDTQCGFKLFHRRTMKIFELQRNNRFGFDFEDVYLARLGGWRVREVPVTWNNDARSKVRPVDYLITLLELFNIHLHRWRGHYPLP